ncbi:DUF3040 domain-containing protein [Saccharopolyspora sp. NPDC000359]|uniref:DUF3040 domain-containing protein n=1 Tax=Saccharopolyspora sp. NPDC000359 TaxID=3154251 RepID=UPI00332E6B46
MLRPHERRRLEEIERELRASDPNLVQHLAQERPLAGIRAWLTPRWVLALGAVLLALLCLLFNESAAFFLSAALAVVVLATDGWSIQAE